MMILKKVNFLLVQLFFNYQVHMDIPFPTSSPPKKPTKPTLNVPTSFRTCCACTCKDYVCIHSQPKWPCHFGSSLILYWETCETAFFRFCFVSAGSWIFRILLRYRLDIPFWTRQKTGEKSPWQVVPSYLRWNALVRRRLKSTGLDPLLKPFGKEKGGCPEKTVQTFLGRGGGFRIFRNFHLWPQWNRKTFPEFFDIPFFVRCLFVFFVASPGTLLLIFFFARPRWQLHRFPFRTTTSSPFFCPLALKNNGEEADTYGQRPVWIELVINWEKRQFFAF